MGRVLGFNNLTLIFFILQVASVEHSTNLFVGRFLVLAGSQLQLYLSLGYTYADELGLTLYPFSYCCYLKLVQLFKSFLDRSLTWFGQKLSIFLYSFKSTGIPFLLLCHYFAIPVILNSWKKFQATATSGYTGNSASAKRCRRKKVKLLSTFCFFFFQVSTFFFYFKFQRS